MAKSPTSKSPAHTPGPYTVTGNEIYGNDGRTIVADVFEENAAWRANARLLAAAPELLEAVVRLLETPDLNLDELDVISVEAIEFAHRAVAKAEGKTPTENTFHCDDCGKKCKHQEDLRNPAGNLAVLCPICAEAEGQAELDRVFDIYRLTATDAQDTALQKLGRRLAHAELRRVKKNFEWGISEQWSDIMEIAIDEALRA